MADEPGFYVIRDLDYSVEPTETQVELVRQRLRGALAEARPNDLRKNLLDVYLPTTAADGGAPVVVFIHGGGWRRGDKDAWNHFLSVYDTNFFFFVLLWLGNIYRNVGEWFARNGVVCVVISYPLARLSFPFNLVEMCTSFVMSLALWTLVVTALAAGGVLCSGLYFVVSTVVEPYMPDNLLTLAEDTQLRFDDSVAGELRDAMTAVVASMSQLDVCCVFLGATQAVTWLCIVYRRRHYRISPVTLALQLVAFVCLLQRLNAHECHLHASAVACCVFLLVVVQGTICTRLCVLVEPAHYPENLNAVVDSIRWTKTFGEKTGLYRPDRLFLMGHSAGGHLASCVALHGHSDRPAVVDEIKGVLSLSAVYDLPPLYDAFVTRHLFLLPTFGRDHRVWLEASPVRQLASRRHQYVPPFLVVTASWDCSLNDQADNFLSEYRRYNDRDRGEISRHVIPDTNHIDIIWKIKYHRLLQTRCIGFIHSVVRRLDASSETRHGDDATRDGAG